MLTYASAFSGIGGFEVGFNSMGWENQLMIEIDKACQAVLSQHFPNVPILGDICDVPGTALNKPDVFVGGFPCQDTSIAAPHRGGLAGERSGLYYQFVRLLDEHLRLVESARPRWVVIENPEGLLASPGKCRSKAPCFDGCTCGVDRTGRDMAAVVSGLEKLGYGWAYRVVDGGALGTTQRRRRVIVVGHRGGDPRPAWAVLGDPDAGGETSTPHRIGGSKGRPVPLQRAHADSTDEAVIWRKSARATKSLAAGGYETWVPATHANTLAGFDGGLPTRQTHLIAQHGGLRTLTHTEWERLQGFPDGWTASMTSSQRWTALGNAVHTGTAAWLARRLTAVHMAVPEIRPL